MSIVTIEEGTTVATFLLAQKKHRRVVAYIHLGGPVLRLASSAIAKSLREDVKYTPLKAEHPIAWRLRILGDSDRSNQINLWFSISSAPEDDIVAFNKRSEVDYQARCAEREAAKSAEVV
jgi:hypothetical protein